MLTTEDDLKLSCTFTYIASFCLKFWTLQKWNRVKSPIPLRTRIQEWRTRLVPRCLWQHQDSGSPSLSLYLSIDDSITFANLSSAWFLRKRRYQKIWRESRSLLLLLHLLLQHPKINNFVNGLLSTPSLSTPLTDFLIRKQFCCCPDSDCHATLSRRRRRHSKLISIIVLGSQKYTLPPSLPPFPNHHPQAHKKSRPIYLPYIAKVREISGLHPEN